MGGSSGQIWQGRWQEYGRPHPSFAGCPSALQATTWWPESSITPKLGRGPHVWTHVPGFCPSVHSCVFTNVCTCFVVLMSVFALDLGSMSVCR